jgi:hypothetical protein
MISQDRSDLTTLARERQVRKLLIPEEQYGHGEAQNAASPEKTSIFLG